MTAAELASWLENAGEVARATTALAGDLSQRKYFRVELADGSRLLAAFYPESLRPAMARFVGAGVLLAGAAVRVPAVRKCDPLAGWMLVEDLGAATLYERADLAPAERLGFLRSAVRNAERIAALDSAAVVALGSPALDAAALRLELEATFEFLFDPRGLPAEPGLRADFSAALDALCLAFAGEPLVPCHRDYMARNLLPCGDEVAVIDFQDLRLGPPAYDLASLLNDSFFPDRELEAALLPARWREGVGAAAYSRAVVQRALKAGGTFARFAARGNPRHLPLVVPTLARALRQLASLPETAAVSSAFGRWWEATVARSPIC